MKMLFVVYSREADEDVIAAFKRAGIGGYTKLQDVCGEGRETEPKLGSHVWPGMNQALFLALEDDALGRGMDVVRQLKRDQPRMGFKAFVFPLEESI